MTELEQPEGVTEPTATDDERLAHLVLRDEWPVALCGTTVKERLGNRAPGRDRCYECLRICQQRGLGRAGWA